MIMSTVAVAVLCVHVSACPVMRHHAFRNCRFLAESPELVKVLSLSLGWLLRAQPGMYYLLQ